MIGRILSVLRVETIKAVRMPSTYFAPAAIILTILLAPLVHSISRDGESDYDFITFAVPLSLNVIGFILILVYASSLFASESQQGTLRMILLRPISRLDLFLAKSLLAFTYAAINILLAVSLALMVATLFGDLNGVHVGGEIVHTNTEVIRTIFLASAATLLPMYAAVALALLVSLSVRTTLGAALLTIGIVLFLDLSKYPLSYWRFSFTTYFEVPWDNVARMTEGFSTPVFQDWYWLVGTPLITGSVFWAAALALLLRKDINA